MYRIIFQILAGVIFPGLFTAGCVLAQEINYSGNLQYATGSYLFQDRTESAYFSNGFGYRVGKWSISFSVPLIYQSSPWISFNAAGSLPTGGPQHRQVRDSSGTGGGMGGGMFAAHGSGTQIQRRGHNPISLPDTSSYAETGFGDPSIFANYKVHQSVTGATSVQLNTGVKFPFANPNSGFGTGEWDLGVGLSAMQRFGKYFVMGTGMKWWFGDMPGLELKNPIAYSFGLGRSLAGGKWLANTTLSGYTPIIEGYDPPMNLNIGLGYNVSQRFSLNGTLSYGLSESSSDFSAGMGWSVRL